MQVELKPADASPETRFAEVHPSTRCGRENRRKRYFVTDPGEVWSLSISGRWRKLTPRPSGKTGHLAVVLGSGSGNSRYAHRLVCEAFIGPCPPGMECCHADDDPSNNALSNLRWDTRLSNKGDAIRNDRVARGERIGNAKLDPGEVPRIVDRRRAGESERSLASEFGVALSTIRSVMIGRTWSHLTGIVRPSTTTHQETAIAS